MTTETLHDTLNYIVTADRDFQLQTSLQSVSTSLTSLVQTPAQPPVQQALAAAMSALDKATISLRADLTPSRTEHISELGGGEFFDPALSKDIRDSIAVNAMTPSVASTYVQDKLTRRATFLQNVKQTLTGMQELKLSGSVPPAGHADITFVIPRSLFDDQLEPFAKELTFISRLIKDISEAGTGKAEAPVLESLSSSTPTVAILAGVGAIKTIAEAVKAFLEVWKQVQELRDTRNKITELGLSGAAISELDDRITEVVEQVVETTTTTSIELYKGESGRRNELESAIRQNTRRLFGQIERGLVVQFRAEPDDESDDKQDDLEAISALSRTMEFPAIASSPLLLKASQLIEGDVEKFTTTTTTKTTTRSTAKEAASKRNPKKQPI